MHLKYIVFDKCFPILFGECIEHKEVIIGNYKPTSAGFVILAEVDAPEGSMFCSSRIIKPRCHGGSVSLNLKSDLLDDEILIGKMLNR